MKRPPVEKWYKLADRSTVHMPTDANKLASLIRGSTVTRAFISQARHIVMALVRWIRKLEEERDQLEEQVAILRSDLERARAAQGIPF